jgi:cysteinyl-tRNA synthetase
MEGYNRLLKLKPSPATSVEITDLRRNCEEAMIDDLNTPIVISHLFDAVKSVNIIHDGNGTISEKDLEELKAIFKLFIEDILGLTSEENDNSSNEAYKKAIDLLLAIRQESKQKKDWETADKIRKQLAEFGFEIKDGKDGVEWTLNR